MSFSKKDKPRGIKTLAIHAGEGPDPATRASSPNIVMSSTYTVDADTAFSIEGRQVGDSHTYTRWTNPTVMQLEQKLAALEGAEAGLAFASGMAAISGLFLYELNPGERLVVSDVSYAGTAELLRRIVPKLGVEIIRCNMSNLDEVARALDKPTRLVYVETPCNPLCRLTDIAAVAEMAHAQGAKLAVDSTFGSPIATRPLSLGADYVIHSLTKYICGHGDAMGGGMAGPLDVLTDIRKHIVVRCGGNISPFNAWLIMRGAATLPYRMAAHQENALAVAKFLEDHPKVARVNYPGLESYPQRELALRQMDNFSGMMSWQPKGDGQALAAVMAEKLQVFHYAVSLGHHRSLIFHMPTKDMLTNSFHLEESGQKAYRDWAGQSIFRTSIGLEDPEDLIDDLAQCLDAC